MTTTGVERQVNRLTALHQRFLEGEQLPAGSLTKILHLLPTTTDQDKARKTIRSAQQVFWREWTPFRGGLESDPQPNFYHVVGCLPVLRQFRDFIGPEKGDLIVDLAGGSAAMAAYFDRLPIAGYISVDSNPLVQDKARKHLTRLGHPSNHVISHDLSNGLPEGLVDTIDTLKPRRVRYISNWGITYLDVASMTSLIRSCLDPEVNRNIPSTLDFNMLTDGKFDPEVLRKRFMREIVPKHIFTLRLLPLIRAMRAIKPIIEFGKALPAVAPIWYPDEIKDLLKDSDLSVLREDATLLWGQSTAMKVGLK